MKNTEQMRGIKRTIIISLVVFCAVFAVAVFSFIQVGSLKRRNARIDEHIVALQSKKSKLEQDLNDAKDYNEDVDTMARDKLDMIKDGETIYYFD